MQERVTGTMPARDVETTIFYVQTPGGGTPGIGGGTGAGGGAVPGAVPVRPGDGTVPAVTIGGGTTAGSTGQESSTVINDYATPLGLGNVNRNTGDSID